MISIQEDERKRISRRLHDQVGQQIIALKLQLEALADGSNGAFELSEAESAQRLGAAINAIGVGSRHRLLHMELRPFA